MKVYVTGIGILSAIGNNADDCLKNLQLGKTGIGKAKHFKSRYTENLNFGEIDLSSEDLKELTNLSGQQGFSRTALLSIAGVEQAVNDAQLSTTDLCSLRTGFISSSTVGGMSNTDELYADANMKGTPSEFVSTYGGGEHTLQIVRRFGIKGFTSTINTACSSSANAIMLGSRLIKSGRLDRVIVGGVDSLAKYTVNGFNALMILSEAPCKPFDSDRVGLTLGEGSGYLVLEGENICGSKRKYAEVKGYGNANDAFHPSATSDEAFGPRLAMNRALESAKIDYKNIDYINAHGTGTPNNDVTEMYAFNQVFNGTIPPFNSTKSYTGHTLAAAGSIEAIFSILSMKDQQLFASLQCDSPINDFGATPIKKATKSIINTVISNSFGFGGNCTSVILSTAK